MTGKEEAITHLAGPPVGVSRRDAELRLLDDDLWFLGPEGRFGFEPEQAVRQWGETVDALGPFIHIAERMNDATYQAMVDARARAVEALRRSQEREAKA
jgi:hypothetical protein